MAVLLMRRRSEDTVTLWLIVVAAVCWWVTVVAAGDMSRQTMTVAFVPYLLGWLAMMAAMMLPAVAPAVRLYARAAALHRVAPTATFVLGYLLVWVATGVPVYGLWRVLAVPLHGGEVWAGHLAGVVLILAGVYQLTPLQRACLRRCRSPMSVFLRARGDLTRPSGAVRVGGRHGVYCLGCCAGLMMVLVAAGGMQPWWAVGIAGVIFVQRNTRSGERLGFVLAGVLAAAGVALLAHPTFVSALS